MSISPHRGRDQPALLPLQPHPVRWAHSYMPGPWGGVTAVERDWEPGDTRLCRLCPECTADHDAASCLVQVRGAVPAESVPLVSLHGRDIHPPPERAGGRVVRVWDQGEAVG